MAKRTPDEKAKLSAAVLAEIHEGSSLRKACTTIGLPTANFLLWVSQDPALADQYAQAREAMIEKLAEDLIEISDEPVPLTNHGSMDSAAVAKQRLQVDTRKWILSKLAPKKYGDRITQEVTGADGGAVQIAISTPEKRKARIAELLAKAKSP